MVSQAAKSLLAANIILPILAITAVCLRHFARKLKSLPIMSDDYVILAALACAIAVCVGGIYAACTGLLGAEFELMTQETYQNYHKFLFADSLINHILYGLIKISVILYYKRIFVTPRFRLFANASIILVAMWMIAAFIAILSWPKGVSSFWTTPSWLDGTQYNYSVGKLITGLAAIDIALDLVILGLPIPVIKNLQMTTARKLSIIGIFLLGAFCIVATAVRLRYTQLLIGFSFNGAKLTSISDKNTEWSNIEACASIVAACLPTLSPIFRGARTPDSVLGSLRSLFSIRSRSLSSFDNPMVSQRRGDDGLSSDTRAWYELRPIENRAGAGGNTDDHDVEAQGQIAKGILVQRTFGSQFE